MDLNNFIEDLSSEKPAPGGGSASALFGVIGSALTSMVCALTKGKAKYSEFEDFVNDQHKQILKLQDDLKILMDEDINAFNKISDAYKMPKNTEEEKQQRSLAIQKALIPATKTPYNIMEISAKGLDITDSLIGKTNALAISDLGCAALAFRSALLGANLNVQINLASLKNPIDNIENDAQQLIERYVSLADKIYDTVLSKL